MLNILVAEDDTNTRKWLKTILLRDGYNVLTAADGNEALNTFYSKHVDLIILDVMLPELDGNSLTKTLRESGSSVPILMASAKTLPSDRCEGLLSGADDYITKPIYDQELLLRVKALLKRAKISTEHRLTVGALVLDYDSLSVAKDNNILTLPKKEFYLLYKLLSNPNKIFTRIQLMDEIWGMNSESVDTTVNVHINRLRKKFSGYPEFDIVAIRGIGYKAVINNNGNG